MSDHDRPHASVHLPSMSLHDLSLSNDPREILARGPADGVGFPVIVHPIPATGRLDRDDHPSPRIYVAHSGVGRRQYRRGLHCLDLQTAPRMIEVYAAGLGFERSTWAGEAGRCVEVQFADSDVEALSGGELSRLDLQTRHEAFDERISSTVFLLAEEVLAGQPSGPLYARGLSLSLLGLLQAHHTRGKSVAASSVRVMSGEQKRRIVDLVAHAFGTRLTIDQLAGELRMSPSHFSRLFKASFGVTPHDYVLRVRLDAATRALQLTGGESISDIAQRCGFSSQSHLTAQMRQHLGTTPLAVRRGR